MTVFDMTCTIYQFYIFTEMQLYCVGVKLEKSCVCVSLCYFSDGLVNRINMSLQ